MANRKTTSTHQKNLYKQYESEGRQHKNRIKRLESQVRHNPEDLQAVEALKRLKASTPKEAYRRNKHKNFGCRAKDGKTLLNVRAARHRAWEREWAKLRQPVYIWAFKQHNLSFSQEYADAIMRFASDGNKVKGFKKAEKVINGLV